MSEADRTPVIQLSVDQEVFIDAVRDGDVVEDATVATEVTSFDRVGDAYVLEGAIVFAGYLTHEGSAQDDSAPQNHPLAFDMSHGQYAKHVHHRMPFVLRVPAKSQPRGIVNVASRISSWQLDVISSGWMRVVADLNVIGLNGENGYHFQCGAQEDGDLFFDQEWNSGLDALSGEDRDALSDYDDADLDAAEAGDQAGDAHGEAFAPGDWSTLDTAEPQPYAETMSWLRGHNEHPDRKPEASKGSEVTADHSRAEQAEAMSAVRGGHDPEPVEDSVEHHAASAMEELRNLDRAFDEQPESVSDAEPADDGPIAADTPAHGQRTEAFGEPAADVTEFEFEHQEPVPKDASEPEDAGEPAEEFVASRGFDDEGFHATAGFAPTVRVGSDLLRSDAAEADAAERDDVFYGTAERTEDAAEMAEVDRDLWSFVDFNAPDTTYTLRYVIVMDEETLELVADRIGCAKTDLMRANGLSDDEVRPGQSLRVPSSAFAAYT